MIEIPDDLEHDYEFYANLLPRDLSPYMHTKVEHRVRDLDRHSMDGIKELALRPNYPIHDELEPLLA